MPERAPVAYQEQLCALRGWCSRTWFSWLARGAEREGPLRTDMPHKNSSLFFDYDDFRSVCDRLAAPANFASDQSDDLTDSGELR